MSEARDKLSAYAWGMDEDARLLTDQAISPKERLAAQVCIPAVLSFACSGDMCAPDTFGIIVRPLPAQLRLGEKRILNGTLGGARRRLAPIRGVPTKKGMQRKDDDILEIFETLESLPGKPKQMLTDFVAWWRAGGDQNVKPPGRL